MLLLRVRLFDMATIANLEPNLASLMSGWVLFYQQKQDGQRFAGHPEKMI